MNFVGIASTLTGMLSATETQVMLNVVTANVWLEASSEDAGKPLTFHGTQATSLAIPRHARFLFGASTRGLHP